MGSRRAGFGSCGTRASVVVAHGLSSCGTRALECRLSSCGAWAQVLCGMWDPPRPGIEPMSPTLAGGFLTTAPPGKSQYIYFLKAYKNSIGCYLLSTYYMSKYDPKVEALHML